MRRLLLLFFLLPLVAKAQPITPASTPFTRTFLRATNAADARTILGTSVAEGGTVTNLTVLNLYTSNFFSTNITVQNNLYTSNFFATNVTVQTINVTSNIFNVGKGGHLTITNDFTPQQVGASKIVSTAADGSLTNAVIGSGITWDGTTLSASGGGGASTWVPVVTLAFVTTNVTVPLNGGTNFIVTLTNAATGFFTSSGAPASAATNASWTLTTVQDGFGGRLMNFDTSVFHFMNGVVPVCTTNANAEDVWTMTTSAKTAGKINVTWNPNFQ